ncbi:MAG: prenyltransferase, partial [Bacteroides sp.]
LVFFGFVPVGITYYIQADNWTMNATIASLVCGLIVDTLLVVNNYRDRDTDAQSGKHTIIVRFGEPFGRYLYLFLGLLAAWLCLLFALDGHLWAALLPQFYLIPHFRTWQRMVKIYRGEELNSILGETSRNMLLMGVLLSIGLLLK